LTKVKIANWSKLLDRKPTGVVVAGVDLVLVRYDDQVSVLYGRCLHRGALLADGSIEADNLICGLHGWDYRYRTGISQYNNSEALTKFESWIDIESDAILIDEDEVKSWALDNPQPFDREQYLGVYADVHGAVEEPYNQYIQEFARNGLKNIGHHGKMSAMGVPLYTLPMWNDIQIVTAQLATPPLTGGAEVDTQLIIGPAAQKPLILNIPIFVSDMSFGALSEEAKIALAMGAEKAGTGICSGEGGMLPEEQNANSKYFYELASGKFGWDIQKVTRCQAFHFKAGQGAKTGTGGHLPAKKVTKKIAQVRGLKEGEAAISPSKFPGLNTPADYRKIADQVRQVTGGIPVGFKLSAQHIEADMNFAFEVGVDYIILDGRGGGTGAAPELFKNNISVPTIPALARARKHLAKEGVQNVSLIITGGLRTESDFLKAMALGADGIAIANSALQAIGCLGMRACNTNNCPVGIATQKEHLRSRLQISKSAEQLSNYLQAIKELMQVMSRACGHSKLSQFNIHDLVTWNSEMAALTGIPFAGISIHE
jgi:nitrite reductase/ring-hydroxylating ferredoxin subunit